MGALKQIIASVQDIAMESIDLFEKRIDLTLRGNELTLQIEETGQAVTLVVCDRETQLDRPGAGLHAELDGLDEYELCDLVEKAIRGGYDYIYIKV